MFAKGKCLIEPPFPHGSPRCCTLYLGGFSLPRTNLLFTAPRPIVAKLPITAAKNSLSIMKNVLSPVARPPFRPPFRPCFQLFTHRSQRWRNNFPSLSLGCSGPCCRTHLFLSACCSTTATPAPAALSPPPHDNERPSFLSSGKNCEVGCFPFRFHYSPISLSPLGRTSLSPTCSLLSPSFLYFIFSWRVSSRRHEFLYPPRQRSSPN